MSIEHAGRDTDLGHLIVEGLGAGRDRVCMMELEFGTPRGLERYAWEEFRGG